MKTGKTLILTEIIAGIVIGLLWLGIGIFHILDAMHFGIFTTGDGLGDALYWWLGIAIVGIGLVAVLCRLGALTACIVASARKKSGGYIVASIMEFVDLGLLVMLGLMKFFEIFVMLEEFVKILVGWPALVLTIFLICIRLMALGTCNIIGTVFLSKGRKNVREDRRRYGLG